MWLKWFKQINQEERIQIYAYLQKGLSHRKISRILKRHHSSISEEIKRNSLDMWRGKTIYKPLDAQIRTIKRRKMANNKHIKLRSNHSLRTKIYSLLSDSSKCRWPDEILWRLKLEWWKVVSTSTLYRYIRYYSNRWNLLRFKQDWYKFKKRKRKKTTTIKNIPKIANRPIEANERSRTWDVEIDTIVSKWHSGWLFTSVDRSVLFTILKKIPNHKSKTLLTVMTSVYKDHNILTITSDNGVEFADLYLLCKRINAKWFTADPYSSYQRWTNERTNWLVRRFIPKWSDISKYTDLEIQIIQDKLNHKPRKKLDYRTPHELYYSTSLTYTK